MSNHIEVRFDWTMVGQITVAEEDLNWPPMPGGAGVYRYTLRLGDRTRYYVGETDNFRRRFSHYRRPGPSQTTNIRMHQRLRTLLATHGGEAEVAVASNVEYSVNGASVQDLTLPEVFTRRLLENAALVELAAGGHEIVNGKGFPAGELWPA